MQEKKRWLECEHEGKKFDLTDVTFTIPVHYEHPDREEGLKRVMDFLHENFNTNIIVGEQGTNRFSSLITEDAYIRWNPEYMPDFHRTKMLNVMAMESNTPIIVNYDADVIIPPLQILLAVKALRNNSADMVFPYDGRFSRITKEFQHLPIDKLYDKQWKGSRPIDPESVGGCVFWNKEKFIEIGMENENFISYGPEDTERVERAKKLGLRIKRIKGQLFHYDHYISDNSCGRNPYFGHNNRELERIRSLTKKQLQEEIQNKWRIKKALN